MIVQTMNPDNSAIQHARRHDYLGFYRDEIALRRELGYPPYGRLINLVISSTNETAARDYVRKLRDLTTDMARRQGGSVSNPGAPEAPLYRVQGRYRWQIFQGPGGGRQRRARIGRSILSQGAPPGIRAKVDVDPSISCSVFRGLPPPFRVAQTMRFILRSPFGQLLTNSSSGGICRAVAPFTYS